MPTEGTGEPPKSFGGRPPEVSLLWFPRGGAEGHFHSYRPLPGLGLWERDREGGTLPSSLSAGSGLLSSQALWTGLATSGGLGRQPSSRAEAPIEVSLWVAGSRSCYFYQPN